MDDPQQMPTEFAERADKEEKPRVVADYIAGMTDRFAISEHERLN
jgi:dGTPase